MARNHIDRRAIVGRQGEDICLARRGGFFPLTLTLSLGEREQRALRSGKPTGVDCSPASEGFTLFPRERAGVRGNGAKYPPACRTNPGMVELDESSDRAGDFP